MKRDYSYIKIWQKANGKIPRDTNGISYEIHHLDKNHKNNSLENLVCVTIQEHYDIHFSQQDYYACACISKRMNMSVEDKKVLSAKIGEANRNRPNPWNDPEIQDRCKKTKKENYKKENHGFFGVLRPEHSEYMKSIGFGKNKTESHLANHRESWLESTKDNPIRAKEWKISYNNEILNIKNLKKFCRDNTIGYSRLFRGFEVDGYKILRELNI